MPIDMRDNPSIILTFQDQGDLVINNIQLNGKRTFIKKTEYVSGAGDFIVIMLNWK